MRCRGWVCRASLVAGWLAAASPARADLTSLAIWDFAESLTRLSNSVLFASLEAGPATGFLSTGVKWAPFGPLNESGFRLLLHSGEGADIHRNATPWAQTSKHQGYALLGLEQMTSHGAISLYLGPEMSFEELPTSPFRSLALNWRGGLRIQAEIWHAPQRRWLLQAAGGASSAQNQLWGRLAAGYRIADLAYVGPELEATAAPGYSKWRFGAHVTDLAFWGANWRASAGRELANDRHRGAYFSVGMYWRR